MPSGAMTSIAASTWALPPMMPSSVDLSAPFGPHSPNNPFGGSVSVTSSSAVSPPYSLPMSAHSGSPPGPGQPP